MWPSVGGERERRERRGGEFTPEVCMGGGGRRRGGLELKDSYKTENF